MKDVLFKEIAGVSPRETSHRDKYSERKTLRQHNNSDKSSNNTLWLSSRTIG